MPDEHSDCIYLLKSPPWILNEREAASTMPQQHNRNKQHVHKVLDDPVELGTFVTKTKLSAVLLDTSRKCAEVLCSLGNSLRIA